MTFCYTCRSVPCFTTREGKRDPKPNIMQRVRDLGTLSIRGTSPPNPSLQDITFFFLTGHLCIYYGFLSSGFLLNSCVCECVCFCIYTFLVQFLWLFFLSVVFSYFDLLGFDFSYFILSLFLRCFFFSYRDMGRMWI